jgi:hypothetical protein
MTVGLALLCALVAVLAFAVAPAAAEEPAHYDGDLQFPAIHLAGERDEYLYTVSISSRQSLVQLSETEIDAEYEGGDVAFSIVAEEAWDAAGNQVPTTVELTGPESFRFVVHDREATYDYPITAGPLQTQGESFFFGDLHYEGPPAAPEAVAPALSCDVPGVVGLSRRAAAKRLRAADCALGTVHLAKGAKAQGKVVKQFRAAGTPLAAGTPVAVKLD